MWYPTFLNHITTRIKAQPGVSDSFSVARYLGFRVCDVRLITTDTTNSEGTTPWNALVLMPRAFEGIAGTT